MAVQPLPQSLAMVRSPLAAREPGWTGPVSSLRIVSVAADLVSVAPVAPLSVNVKYSSGSTAASPLTTSEIVRLVWPGANVSVPLAAT